MSERISDERLVDLIGRCETDARSYDRQAESSPTPDVERGWALVARDEASALRELAELRERVRWRPMEEAPKDGSHVLLYRPHIRFVGYHSDAGWCINAPGLPLMQPEPTGWMPLPEIGPLPGGDV